MALPPPPPPSQPPIPPPPSGPSQPPSGSQPPSAPSGAPVPPGAPGEGYYPQQAYYAPGWTAPPQRRPPRSTGRAVAIVLAVVIGLVAVGTGSAAAIRWFQLRPIGEVDSATTATVRQVASGHCIAELTEDGPLTRVRLVPCDEPHEAEVVGTLPMQDGPWPGRRSAEEQAARWCELDARQHAVGAEAVTWLPTEQSWSDGDRQIVCLVRSTTGPVTGSWSRGETPS